MFQKVKSALESRLPSELAKALLSSYEDIKQNYFLGKHESSELKGGKFVEACIRILQFETSSGNYTPIGTKLPNVIGSCRNFEQIPKQNVIDSFRIHIPRALVLMYNIRNQRGVGHLGGDVNSNYSDATLLVGCANWILAELFRIYFQCSLEEAQGIVDALVQRRLLLVHEFENIKRVLLPSLSLKDQTLLLLTPEYPNKVSDKDLVNWIEPSNPSYYRKIVLKELHSDRMIECDKTKFVRILPPGLKYVERQYPIWLNKLN